MEDELIEFLKKVLRGLEKENPRFLDLKKLSDLAIEAGLDVGDVIRVGEVVNKLIEDKVKEMKGEDNLP
ncbi:hypothetical protein [Ferroglobus sp.]|uniref:hypothetical protein n=1 Tax=Ferroglobus sp. TaxID=2614230 RepID=UPI0025BD7CA1|nr:hypothetical protein [Ferroglobus sp.]